MLIRPLHYWLAFVVSVLAVFVMAVAAQTLMVLRDRELVGREPEEAGQVDRERDVSEEVLAKSDPPREVVILPPARKENRRGAELPDTWREMISKPEVVEEEKKREEENRRYDRLVESIGLASETSPETDRISDRDMAASSKLAAADGDGEEVPTTEGMDDGRLDSIVDTEFGEGAVDGAGGVASSGVPAPVAQAGSVGGAAKVVQDVLEIPGLDQIPVLPEVNDAETKDGDALADTGEKVGPESADAPRRDDSGDAQMTTAGGGSGDIQRIKRRYRGRLDARGIDSLAARGTELGKYLSVASKRVTKNWQRACHDPVNGQYITNGMIRLVMKIGSDGSVDSVFIEHAEGVTEVQKNFTKDAVKNTQLQAFPESLIEEIGSEPIEVEYDFLFFVG